MDSVRVRRLNSVFGLYLNVDLDSARYYGEKGREMAIEIDDSVLLASNTLNFGAYYWYMGDFTKAMECYVQAATIFDKHGSETDVADTQINIALIHYLMGQATKAKPVFREAIEIYSRNNYPAGLANANHYLGLIYQEEANYDSAIYFFHESVKYASRINLTVNEARGLSGLGMAYQQKGDLAKAKEYQLKSLEVENQIGNRVGMLQSYILLGSLELDMGNYAEAEQYFVQAEAMPELKMDLVSQRNLYQEFVKLYEATDQIAKAYSSYKKHVVALDSIKNSEDLATINELNEKYESEKKASEILALQKDKELNQLTLEKERTQKSFFIAASVVFLLLSSGLIFGYIQLRKSKNQIAKRNETITRINKALNKSQDDLLALNSTKDKFFALIAHDLRGPITSLQGIGRMLAYYNKKGEEQRVDQMIAQVDQSAQTVNHLLDNLLKWALSQTNGLNFQPSEFEIRRLIDECTLIFDENLRAKALQLDIDLDEDIQVKADYNMISTVLRNLLSNAIKFSPVGGRITLTVVRDDDQLRLSVTDSGTGMSPDMIARVQRNQNVPSTKGTQDEKGTGLGLLLCKEFVQKHHSDLSIDSSHLGTTVSFTLRLVGQVANASL